MPLWQLHTVTSYSIISTSSLTASILSTFFVKKHLKISALLILMLVFTSKTHAQLFVSTNQAESIESGNIYSSNIDFVNMTFDDLLQQADDKRSSHNQLSVNIINYLYSKTNQLSKQQKEYLTYLRAYQFTFSANYQAAIPLFKQLIKTSQQPQLRLRSHETLISLFSSTQQWDQGLLHIQKLIDLINNADDKKLTQGALITVTAFFNQLGQYQEALHYLEQVKQSNITDIRDTCFINQQYALVNLRLLLAKSKQVGILNTETLIEHISKSIGFCQQANEPLITNLLRSYLAELELFYQQAERALTILLPNINEVITTNFPTLINLTYNLIAQAYWQQGDITNTEKYITLAQKKLPRLADTQQSIITYKLLSQLAERQGRFEQAFQYHRRYSKVKQKVADEEQAKQLAFQLAKQSDYQRKEEIKRISQQNSIFSSTQHLIQQQEGNHLLLIILLIVLLITLFFWGYKSWLTQQKLKLLTEYDYLTQVNNRAQFIRQGQQTVEQCQAAQKPVSCIMFDLDHFKSINDKYGHIAGDTVLQQVSLTCKHICRPNDFIGRIGGEEFAILLPECTLLVAEDIANRCLTAVASISFAEIGINTAVTASFGVSCTEHVDYSFTRLLADADSAMYSSKHHGRNCVNVYR